MLIKLMKHEFRATGRIMLPLYLVLLVTAVGANFTTRGLLSTQYKLLDVLGALLVMAFVVAIMGVCVMSMVVMVQRFYKNLLGDEGYLMHTLPVHTWQLILSKLLCALVTTIVNGVVGVAALFLMMPLEWSDLFDLDLWKRFVQGLMEQPDAVLYLVEFLVMILVVFAMIFTSAYLSMAIGHLFHRRRVLMSVAAYMGLDIVGSLVLNVLDRLSLYPMDWALNLDGHLSLWAGIALLLVPTVLMFLGTSYILKNRLNLE